MPRCAAACGNPLKPPAPTRGGAGARGTPWAGYRPNQVVVVTPAPRAVPSITIVDAATRTWIERRVGPDVRRDRVVPPPAGPPPARPRPTRRTRPHRRSPGGPARGEPAVRHPGPDRRSAVPVRPRGTGRPCRAPVAATGLADRDAPTAAAEPPVPDPRPRSLPSPVSRHLRRDGPARDPRTSPPTTTRPPDTPPATAAAPATPGTTASGITTPAPPGTAPAPTPDNPATTPDASSGSAPRRPGRPGRRLSPATGAAPPPRPFPAAPADQVRRIGRMLAIWAPWPIGERAPCHSRRTGPHTRTRSALNRMGSFDWDLDAGLFHMDAQAFEVFDLRPEEYDGRPGEPGRPGAAAGVRPVGRGDRPGDQGRRRELRRLLPHPLPRRHPALDAHRRATSGATRRAARAGSSASSATPPTNSPTAPPAASGPPRRPSGSRPASSRSSRPPSPTPAASRTSSTCSRSPTASAISAPPAW